MTQEQKELLLKDLCARLPYGVKIAMPGLWDSKITIEPLNEIFKGDDDLFRVNGNGHCIEYIKPYLFPLSSITVEQKNSFPFSYSFLEALIDDGVYFDEDECITLNDMIVVIQWCYKNHFDIHGLIPKGLAIDATGKNIY